MEQSINDGNDSPTSDGKEKNLVELEYEATLRSAKGRAMRSGARRKGNDKVAKEPKNGGKQRTIWDDTKVSKKEAKALDRSKTVKDCFCEPFVSKRCFANTYCAIVVYDCVRLLPTRKRHSSARNVKPTLAYVFASMPVIAWVQ